MKYSFELDEFLKSWEKFQADPDHPNEQHPQLWTSDIFTMLTELAPELAFRAILRGLEILTDPKALGALSAGPLEDLLGNHGELLIDRVEEEARKNAGFRTLLDGMYQNKMSDEIWRRVEEAAKSK